MDQPDLRTIAEAVVAGPGTGSGESVDTTPGGGSADGHDTGAARVGSWVGGSDAPETTELNIGFMPLSDSASLIAAAVFGFDRKFGIRIRLTRETAWSGLRDKVTSGQLDAAQMLYGMVYGIELGLEAVACDMAVLMGLSQNGQGITLANHARGEGEDVGTALARLTRIAKAPAALGHTFRTGTHAMWLYYWLGAHGIDPFVDLRCVTVPPPRMVAGLRREEISGCCVGEPWNAVAADLGVGHTVATSQEIWPDHPEKALACRRAFVERCPNAARALVMAVLEASRHLEDPENLKLVAALLARAEYIGSPLHTIEPRLLGQYDDGRGRHWRDTHAVRFHAGGEANFPFLSDAMWFMTQHRRWSLLQSDPDYVAIAQRVQQVALYREAAGALGVALPVSPLRSSRLSDGRLWDGSDPAGYARSFEVGVK